jgi:hypothetical protein
VNKKLKYKLNEKTNRILSKCELDFIIYSYPRLFTLTSDNYSVIFIDDLEKLKFQLKKHKKFNGYTELEIIRKRQIYKLSEININSLKFKNKFYVFPLQNRKMVNQKIKLENILIVYYEII